MLNWNTKISNVTEVALSMPKAYARACVVNLPKDKREDGSIDFTHASTQFEVGDKVMFVPFDSWDRESFEQAGEGNVGMIFTVKEITGTGFYTFKEGTPTDHQYFVIKFAYNDNPIEKTTSYVALVPITVEMLNARKADLRKIGLKQPGWYRYRRIEREEPLTPIILCELVVSLKNFHSPQGAASGDVFQPVPDAETTEDGMMVFKDNVGPEDDQDGSIVLS